MRRAALCVLLAAAAAGCASVLGIPDVTLEGDGGGDGGVPDATMPRDGNMPPLPDGGDASAHDAAPPADGAQPVDAPSDTFVQDTGVDAPPPIDAGCDAEPGTVACSGLACGSTTNNCGATVSCPNTCNPTNLCGVGGVSPNQCCAPSCNAKTCGQSDGCLSTCVTNNGCSAPKSCGTTDGGPIACVNDGDCTGGTHTTDCPATGATIFWNCSTKPSNLTGCVQVDQAMFNNAYCCPP